MIIHLKLFPIPVQPTDLPHRLPAVYIPGIPVTLPAVPDFLAPWRFLLLRLLVRFALRHPVVLAAGVVVPRAPPAPLAPSVSMPLGGGKLAPRPQHLRGRKPGGGRLPSLRPLLEHVPRGRDAHEDPAVRSAASVGVVLHLPDRTRAEPPSVGGEVGTVGRGVREEAGEGREGAGGRVAVFEDDVTGELAEPFDAGGAVVGEVFQ
mmetsp:Transcript_35978/g.70797  ORF Transcript_35978/g.70797 Transcript_35978/m.70797 type:complete len:205 (-) Transcript_35978:377-991(-)